MLLSTILPSICVMAALVLVTEAAPRQDTIKEGISPCPNLFRYDTLGKPDEWSGTLQLESEDDLYGVWIRLIFDNVVKKVSVEGDYEVVQTNGKNEVLIKNRDVLLKADSQRSIKITVKYSGKFPNLAGYRLNAKVLCPEVNTNRADFFQGDSGSKDFLATVLSNSKPISPETPYECGTISTNSPAYPWQAAIFIKKDNVEQYVCEGTLISASHIVTSAHCVTFNNENTELPTENLLIYLSKASKLTVKSIEVNGGYDPNTLANDIAVLELTTALTINDNVRPICLNKEGSSESIILTGYNIEKNGKIGDKPTESRVEKLDTNSCVKRASTLENILGEDTYCLSYLSGNKNCVGDSGSSLVSQNSKVSTLKGIVSVGVVLQNKNECTPDNVVVVTDVTKHLKWLLRAIN